jgi:hypothetical protein
LASPRAGDGTQRGEELAAFVRDVYDSSKKVGKAWVTTYERKSVVMTPDKLKTMPPMTACVLGVPNQRRLKAIEKKLIAEGIAHVAIREPDAPWNGQLMTIGLYPCERTDAVDILGRLKLL